MMKGRQGVGGKSVKPEGNKEQKVFLHAQVFF
jgi:hypothetical protein